MGINFLNLVKHVLSGECLDPRLNKTLFVLIPKVNGTKTVNQFRPISLCNVLYKIVTKTIVIRLRPAMLSSIKQNQSSFIASRNISNNIILAHEDIHTMKTIKSKKGWMVIKVDLEKAFDRIRWDFLRDTLVGVGFPGSLIYTIM